MGFLKITGASFLGLLLSQSAFAACPTVSMVGSATLSREINGISLGMHIDEVKKAAKIEHVAFETYRFDFRGTHYEVGLAPSGRIFRIATTRNLGRFVPDRPFVQRLTGTLSGKYGTPNSNSLPGGVATWELGTQSVPKGQPAGGNVNRLAVSLTSEDDQVALTMFFIDFRLVWQDQAAMNCDPARAAENRISF